MALTSTTTFDLVGQTQTINFYQGATLVDQIVYSNNQINFSTISTFDLSKSDLLLYFKYINAFFNTLYINFPSIGLSSNAVWPLCLFEISETDVGVLKIIYTQNSIGSNVYTITYLPIATSCSFAARTSITITLQEFFMMINMLTQYNNQISLN